MSQLGRHCEFEPKRSGHRRDADRLARGVRPLNLVQLTFALTAVTSPNDCLVSASVSSPFTGPVSAPAGGFNRSRQHTKSCVSSRSVVSEAVKQLRRIYYSDSQKALMWERWKQGATLHQIAKLFDRAHTSVRGVLAGTGGIRPPARRRSVRALTLAEREEISRAVATRCRSPRRRPGVDSLIRDPQRQVPAPP